MTAPGKLGSPVRTGGFRFAVVLSLALAATAVAVALTYHLPLRDPDGVAVPDLRPAPDHPAAGLPPRRGPPCRVARPLPGPVPRTLAAVVRERWPWEHIRFALVGLGAWYLTYAAFRNLKSFVPFVNRNLWDTTLATSTGSCSSATSLRTCCTACSAPASRPTSSPSCTSRGSCSCRSRWSSPWSGRATDRRRVVRHRGRPSTGCSAWRRTSWCRRSGPSTRAQDFVALPHTYVTTLQDAMIQDRYTCSSTRSRPRRADDRGLRVAARRDHGDGLPDGRAAAHEARGSGSAMWVFLALTVVATVYLGWHYFVDALGGAVLGAAGVWIAALGTGNHERGGRGSGPRARAGRGPSDRLDRAPLVSPRRARRAAGRRSPPPRRCRRTSCGARRSPAGRRPWCGARRAGAGAATLWLTVLFIATNEPWAPRPVEHRGGEPLAAPQGTGRAARPAGRAA